jgi:hypothetical protein
MSLYVILRSVPDNLRSILQSDRCKSDSKFAKAVGEHLRDSILERIREMEEFYVENEANNHTESLLIQKQVH